MKWRGCGRKWSWPNCSCDPAFATKMTKTAHFFSQESRFLGSRFEPETPRIGAVLPVPFAGGEPRRNLADSEWLWGRLFNSWELHWSLTVTVITLNSRLRQLMDMGYEFHAPAALNRAGTERRLDGHDVFGRGGKEKRSCSSPRAWVSLSRRIWGSE